MSKPVGEPPTPMPSRVGIAEHRPHPDLTSRTNLDGTGRHIVRPQIESAAACQFEARVMPVAGQNSVLDAAAIERETHMWAAIVEGEHAPLRVHEEDRAMAATQERLPACTKSEAGVSMATISARRR